MNKRALVKTSMVGKTIAITIQGTPQTIDVVNGEGEKVQSIREAGTVLQRMIFNCKANSEIAMKNPRNHAMLQNGLKAEKFGKPVVGTIKGIEKAYTADEWFNAFLNAVQLSFGVLLPAAITDDLGNRVEIAAKVQKIDTENGSLLTLDPSTIRVKAPEVLEDTKFSMESFLGESDEDETEEFDDATKVLGEAPEVIEE
jgi:hypothetical protein